jgi:TRAP-type mannitol/chloroaromatic compound transport system substrate-binding protein
MKAILFAAAFALAAAMPGALQAQTKVRMQSAFPPKGTFADNLQFFAERVKVMSGGRLEIIPIPTGSVVPPFEVLDATHKKVIDGAHSSSAYWVGKNRAAALFGVTPGGPFGMDGFDYMGWLYDGGGLELYREFFQVVLQRNVEPIPMTSAGPQALGWFKRPVKSWADFKGLKCRQTGISAEVFTKSGMSTVNMAGGEIVPAAQRGVIDCAEWVGPSDDMLMGFHQVWKHFYTQSSHDLSLLEIIINADLWKALTPDLQAIVQAAAIEATLRSQNRRNRLDAEALEELRTKHGVRIHRTPRDILTKMLEAWDGIAQEEAAKNPFFRKVYESQRAYASKVVTSRLVTAPSYGTIAEHYWREKREEKK